MRLLLVVFVCVFAVACRASDKTEFIIDSDEDGYTDEEDCDDKDNSIGLPVTYYTDADGDGYGDFSTGDAACTAPWGSSLNGDDCDDENAAYNPAAAETDCTDPNDYNCDGSVGFADADSDGFAACEECDDANPAANPAATEVCDGFDNDCDGQSDESDALDASTWYADSDADTYGNAGESTVGCSAPVGYVADATDCDDTLATVSPGTVEVCNHIDDDCDGFIDDADPSVDTSTATTWYVDTDVDGYGNDALPVVACDQPESAASLGGDCNDDDSAYNPGADESDCTDPNDYNCDGSVGYADADADGFVACEECDDLNADTFPGADEVCDSADNDCDGEVDEPSAIDAGIWYADADSDTYGDLGTSTAACDAPVGYVADATDCDDALATVNPAATEVCNDDDDDCDGLIDDADGSLDRGTATTWYADADADAYGDGRDAVLACVQPASTASLGGDCNDADAAYHPGADESDCTDPNDYNCDGSVGYDDSDGDGFPACEECDDASATNFPGADEWCDSVDNDCDGEVDESDALDAGIWYADADGDSYGDAANTTTSCSAPVGSVSDATDCDDAVAAVNPGAAETCNGIDDDCDTLVDDADPDVDLGSAGIWYTDADADTYGDAADFVLSCEQPSASSAIAGDCDDTDAAYNPGADESDCADPNDYNCDGSTGYADSDGDGFAACDECDDSNASNFPGAAEWCDSVDNDCDGTIDEPDAIDAGTWYADRDTDGFGDVGAPSTACDAPAGHVVSASDCNDGVAAVNPDAVEICNAIDDDCDALVDDADTSLDTSTATLWYTDADFDGYGGESGTYAACDAPADTVGVAGDCDDTDSAYNPGALESDCADPNDYNCDGSVGFADDDGDSFAACEECDDGSALNFPGADESCDGVDNDCDGAVDESGADGESDWYADADSDGYGDAAALTQACSAPAGFLANANDCDDAERAVNPGATEVCNGIDDDCDAQIDDADPDLDGSTAGIWYTDADADGYGTSTSTIAACDAPDSAVAASGDCDDSDPAYNPGAAESDCADPNDYNCDGSTGYADADGDGFAACEECDDTNAANYPGADEVCDSVDNDCDGSIDAAGALDAGNWYADRDNDGFGDAGVVTAACSAPVGYVADASDCDDTTATINPDATEVCNGIDDDCDALVDDADESLDAGTVGIWYTDLDADGYGDGAVAACDAPSGAVAVGGDCDDADADYNPGEIEADCTDPNDYNCDGSVGYVDNDGDGFAACEECDDGNELNFPGAAESCDGVDNDCDGDVDESGSLGESTWYADMDADRYGDRGASLSACLAPAGYLADATDCNDAVAAVNPGAIEVCNGIDDDCDALVDDADGTLDGSTASTWYTDADSDGYGDATVAACTAPSGSVAVGGDCNDADAAYNPGEIEADCTDPNDYNCDGSVGFRDEDADGFAACEECDDTNGAIFPGATELCNGRDDDCDTTIDEGVTRSFYADVDSDGYGNAGSVSAACAAPLGYVSDATDCDDTRSVVNPGETEICNGFDDDCDTLIDDSDGSLDATSGSVWYADVDADAYGDGSASVESCIVPAGFVSDSADCDDSDGAVNPGEAEVCNGIDDNCDGSVDEGTGDGTIWYADADADGFGNVSGSVTACSAPSGYVADATDCDDTRATVNPVASEYCNGIDDDCDGTVDNGALDAGTWYADADTDGYGNGAVTLASCSAPSGYVASATDCDDTRSSVNPAASERCNSRDDDCDGTVDNGATDADTWYADVDTDGYGNAASSTESCSAPAGYVADLTDCNDAVAAIHPGAAETCNLIDDDCDSVVDEGTTSIFYADADTDGFGNAASTTAACTAPSGYVADATDCDDTRATVNPVASEYCNGIDDNCDGTVDNGALDAGTWYADADTDGYGDSAVTLASCSVPSGYVASATDCDDTRSSVNPAAAERCNSRDDDCDGTVDNGATDADTWYADVDTDGYGNAASSTESCSAPAGYVADLTDCNDADATIHPGATETCNLVDDDCDSVVDEGTTSTFYADADTDGYGDIASTTAACTAPSGYVRNRLDCDDTDVAVNPGMDEYCNGIDDNCDGTIDEETAIDALTWYTDADDDGFGDAADLSRGCTAPLGTVSDDTDCDDTDDTVNPDADEYCNGVDDDCNGTIDDDYAVDTDIWYADADGDDFGDVGNVAYACSTPIGYVADATDCNDDRTDINPDATEVCDGFDNDCDGDIDDADASLDLASAQVWYVDLDLDGYGAGTAVVACEAPADGVVVAGDCDDTDAAYNPGALELDCADPNDYNCDGSVGYADADGDGVAACDDCDDGNAANYPGADEYCDGADNDCDGQVDEADALDAEVWFADADGDGYGDSSVTETACLAPVNYVADDTDCDDTNLDVNPAQVEYCNAIDDDCDGLIDENAVDASTWYADADGDTYGDLLTTATACEAPAGYVADSTDCDDTDPTINPAGTEVCDTLDNDCDGLTDEDGVCPCDTYAYGGSTYMFCGANASWADARTQCLTYGYDLVAINDEDENTFVYDTARSIGGAKWWTGGNDLASEDVYAWSNGDTMSYTNWRAGQPDDRRGEDCIQIGQHKDKTWQDAECSRNARSVCEQ